MCCQRDRFLISLGDVGTSGIQDERFLDCSRPREKCIVLAIRKAEGLSERKVRGREIPNVSNDTGTVRTDAAS